MPSKIYRMAKAAFDNEYDAKTVLKWLKVFYKRFFAQQFKRSTLPDGPKVGSCSLSPRGDWRMPSDACANEWLRECDNFVPQKSETMSTFTARTLLLSFLFLLTGAMLLLNHRRKSPQLRKGGVVHHTKIRRRQLFGEHCPLRHRLLWSSKRKPPHTSASKEELYAGSATVM